MFNKNKYRKINDKKILHKIKSHWCVISVALLGMIGGVAMTHANVNADVNPQNSDNNQVNHSVSSVSSTQNEPQLVNNQSNHGDLYGVHHDRNVDNVSSQSTNLHNRIIKQGAQTSRYHSIHNSRLLGTSATSSSSMNASQVSMAESSEASSAASSEVAHGGHRISVSPSVRSDMMSGASEIASYNQITRSNAYATASYLDSLSTTTPKLASEKSSAESYVMSFYGNKHAKSDMMMDNEAAHDIKIWGEDPDFFTLYQAEPDSIVNNVRTMYEPTASAFAVATGDIEAKIKSLYTSQTSRPSNVPQSVDSAPASSTNVTPQSNPQTSLNSSMSSNVAPSASNNYSSSVTSSSNTLRTLGSVPPSSSSNNVSHASNVAKNKAVNKSDDPSTDQKTSADPDDSDADDNDQADPQDPSTNSAGARSSDPSTNDAQWNAKGISNVNNGQNEQTGTSQGSAPTVNNDPENSTSVGDNQSSSNGKLPQTNEASSSKGEEMAEISLIISTTFGALGTYIDKHRRDNE